MTELEISLPGHSYSILIGKDILRESAGLLRSRCPGGRAAVVSDETVWKLHGERLENVFREQGITLHVSVIPPGEQSKSLDMLGRLYGEFARFGLKRGDPVIAFGGGVVGDLAGLAAATFMRGVPFIQIPTTLLAQVDSSVGGKVAVNLPEGKNLVGSFWQPSLVVADTELLSTLPEREWKAGMAEVVKYAAIGEALLAPLLENQDEIGNNLEEIVRLCCKCKAGYVERDERDTGLRMMLNFGHTFGHAIEKNHSYEKYNHGEAVAIGMALAVRAGTLLGLTEDGTEESLTALMDSAGICHGFEDKIEEIIPLMSGDKKNSGEEITLVLLERMGSPFIHRVRREELLNAFGGGNHE